MDCSSGDRRFSRQQVIFKNNLIKVKQPIIAVACTVCGSAVFPHSAGELGWGTVSCADAKVKLLGPEWCKFAHPSS